MSISYLGMQVDGNTEFETVIGLEVHVQLATESKIFSTARSRQVSVAEEAVNANTTPVDTGHPGTLPAINKKAVQYAIKAGLATDCKINTRSIFARKHYFYPDSPKGYQISQYDLPLCERGHLDIELGDPNSSEREITKRVGITRIHMEEDAGKSIHYSGYSLVNLNRCGTPLVEVVSEPDMRSAAEAGAYLRKLYAIVTSIGVCDGNLQEGNFRCDANVSIRPKGSNKFGTRTEIKNVNSFRFVEKAIEVEAERQRHVILSGASVVQETRLYDSQKNTTASMRTKEEAEDYRYFPDPDLPPLVVEQALIDRLRSELPELPDQKRDRFVKAYGITRYDAAQLAGSSSLSLFFEAVLRAGGFAKTVANLLNGEVTRLLNESGFEISATKFTPDQFASISKFVADETLSVTNAKKIVGLLFNEGGEVETIIKREGLKQEAIDDAVLAMIDKVIADNPKQVEEFKSGKEKVIGFLVGQLMKATQGKFNPKKLQEILIQKIKGN